MMEEREKRILYHLLSTQKITEEELQDIDYYEEDIEKIKDNRYWQSIVWTRDKKTVDKTKDVLNEVLGSDWKDKYDYKESKEKGKYGLVLYLTDEENETICKAYDERR